MRMIGKSPAFLACVDNLTRVAESEAAILLYGESGVGKELAAQYVHRRSSRESKAFIAVDCASIAESMFESELFGHDGGRSPGSVGRKLGLFELAKRWFAVLDEIGEIPLGMQAKLLRVLETSEYRRVGGTETLHADVRVISATNRDLLDMAEQGRFRLDLYYRIGRHRRHPASAARAPQRYRDSQQIPDLAHGRGTQLRHQRRGDGAPGGIRLPRQRAGITQHPAKGHVLSNNASSRRNTFASTRNPQANGIGVRTAPAIQVAPSTTLPGTSSMTELNQAISLGC